MAEPLWDFTLKNTLIENTTVVIAVLQDISEMIIMLTKFVWWWYSYEPYKHVDQENFTHNKKDTTKGGIAVTETASLIRRR